ncbi:MAG: phage tail protein [Armatimonadota bacterium]|nr:phage tail protein [bacterium]
MIYTEVGFRDDALEEVRQLLKGVERGAEKAMTRALNRVAVGARAEIVKVIAQKHEIRNRDIRDAIKIKKANYDTLEAQVHSFGSVIGLEDFKTTPSGYKQPRPKVGIQVKVRKDSSGGRIPGTFFMPNKKPIFVREGDEIMRKFGPAIPSMMRVALDEDGEQSIQDNAENRLIRELDHEVQFMLSKGAK